MAALSLAKLRFNAGLTPEELGKEVGVSGRTIRRLEGGSNPTAATAKKLADHFKVQPSDLWPISDTEAAGSLMLLLDPSVLLFLVKAFLVLCLVCTVLVFTLFGFEQRAYNRQLCRSRERRLRTAAAVDHHRNDLAEACKVIGGSGGRR